MKEQAVVNKDTKLEKGYLTTTELARLCGVSRFTVINWIKAGRIKTVRTAGRHYRIAVSDAVSFLETLHLVSLHKKKKSITSGSMGHCWECREKTNCDKECSKCLICGNERGYCFVAVREFDRGVIRCEGDCVSCGYFEEFFGLHSDGRQLEEVCDEGSQETSKEKRNFLYNFLYGAGRRARRLKGRVAGLRGRFTDGTSEIDSEIEKCSA